MCVRSAVSRGWTVVAKICTMSEVHVELARLCSCSAIFTWKNNKQNIVTRLGYLADIFSEMNQVSLLYNETMDSVCYQRQFNLSGEN